jgi:hypothetical protein
LTDGGEERLRQGDAAARHHPVEVPRGQDFVPGLESLCKAASALPPEAPPSAKLRTGFDTSGEARERWAMERAQAVLQGPRGGGGSAPGRHPQATEPERA